MDGLKIRLRPPSDKLCFAFDDAEWTFAQVGGFVAGARANILRQVALEPGDRAAILMRSPVTFAVTLLALMRMRVVSVPLNIRLTASELAWQMRNADADVLLCESTTHTLADATGAKVIGLPYLGAERLASECGDFGTVHLDEAFAIVHTSGTSGRPKGAILTYGNMIRSAVASKHRLNTGEGERWLCVMPLYHVGGLSIVLRSLLYGTAVEFGIFDAQETNRALSENPITIVSLVPTMLHRLLDVKTRAWNPRLRLILLGGDAPAPELVERCMADDLPVATTYGLTEAASQVATAMPDAVYKKPGSVGKPLMSAHVRILDECGADAAPAVPGEVLVQGGSVMRGYCGDPAATRAALRNGWLHTGDIGYLDADGDLFILQRREDLIVSGGENIYPAEVERALRRHPQVAEAVAFGIADAEWGQCVAAVVQRVAGASLKAEQVRAFARERLAAYKIPRQIAIVDDLPRTASGKVQRQAARQLCHDANSSAS